MAAHIKYWGYVEVSRNDYLGSNRDRSCAKSNGRFQVLQRAGLRNEYILVPIWFVWNMRKEVSGTMSLPRIYLKCETGAGEQGV